MSDSLPAGVSWSTGPGGLPRLDVSTRACTAELYLHGAHLTAWQPAGHNHPVLWMSGCSRFESGVPIRGGIPVCFPWFGPNPALPGAPPHGVARLRTWQIDSADVSPDGTVCLVLGLTSNVESDPAPFALRMTFSLGATLTLALEVHNPGQTPLTCAEALHTYLTVGDVRQTTITGLAGATYLDKTDGGARQVQGGAPITIDRETDRLYVDTDATIEMNDPVLGRRIRVSKAGSRSSVVWNPWIAKSRAMPDFGDDEWPGMICLETVNAADNQLTIAPGARHTMAATLEVW